METEQTDDQSAPGVFGSIMKNTADALGGDPNDDNPPDIQGAYDAGQGSQNRDPDLGEEDVDSGPGSA
jgi:hypothetical protein